MRGILHVSGIVQGVGFRPYVYRLAKKLELSGFVLNMGNSGVKIELEGEKEDILAFINELETNHPKIARIDKIDIRWSEEINKFSDFKILKSIEKPGDLIVLPPDVAICEDCLAEFNDPRKFPNRYYRYPFIACSVCGPRYTTVVDLPYDRPLTTMDAFPLCKDCAQEYENPNERRYHAQTYACRICGPQFRYHDTNGDLIDIPDPFEKAVNLIREGGILALMGIGGVHLVCQPEDDPVLELRTRKRKRKYKPFAVMSPSIEKIRTFAIMNELEKNLLLSYRRPIILLQQNENYYLSEALAPGLTNIGVFLPYSGIHYLLFENSDFPALVMTSGNISHLPMAIDRETVIRDLKGLADGFLLHDRPIHQRVDDSVVRIIGDKTAIIRRSRGYVPEHIDIPFTTEDFQIIAFGPELHSTGAVLKKGRCFPTQHIGDVTSLELLDFLDASVSHLMKLLRVARPDTIVCDKNPVFLSTRLAKQKKQEYNCELVQIQHHHAHLLGLMAEHRLSLEDEMIGIALDGVGYGKEGEVWGGEIFKVNYSDFKSLAQLELQPMPGGDRCVYYPVRMVIAILSKKIPSNQLQDLIIRDYLQGLPYQEKELEIIFNQLDAKNKLYYSSSMGRVLDSLSALLQVCNERTYEGEPAIRLEHFAMQGDEHAIKFKFSSEGSQKVQINTSELIIQALRYKKEGKRLQDIAASAQYALAEKIADISIEMAQRHDLRRVGLSGGVAYNSAITLTIKNEVEAANLEFLQHNKVPPGDAGVSIGQCIFGAAKLIQERK